MGSSSGACCSAAGTSLAVLEKRLAYRSGTDALPTALLVDEERPSLPVRSAPTMSSIEVR